MEFAVDRIEEDKVVLENIKTKEKRIVEKESIPKNISDGSIIIYENNTYKLDKKEEQKRKNYIEEKLNQLK